MWNFGIRGNVHAVLCSYLKDRGQAVRINNCVSSVISVSSGVPQGSHIGPLLFSLYINNIVPCIKNARILLYADDVKLLLSVNSNEDAVNLKIDINALYEWSIENGLHLNSDKCKIMFFYRNSLHVEFDYLINNFILNHVDVIKDLGVLFDSKVTFAPHLNSVISKSFKRPILLTLMRLFTFIKPFCYHLSLTVRKFGPLSRKPWLTV